MSIDDVLSCSRGSVEPGESNSEVDNDKSYASQQEEHVLGDGTDVAAEGHVSTLLCILIVAGIVVIRSLRERSVLLVTILY